MDLVLTIVFLICAILAVAGALGASLGPSASWRQLGLLAVAVGTAGVLASLSAGFAALVAVVCLGASAVLLSAGVTGAPRGGIFNGSTVSGQAGAVAAALLLLVLLVVAVRGTFAAGGSIGPGFDAAAVGRAFFTRDALALEAVGAMLTVALAAGAMARRRRL
ncbi:MAG TPA: hypothetical protein VGO86_09725 [Candidatus Dormibacteraeota bacterium]